MRAFEHERLGAGKKYSNSKRQSKIACEPEGKRARGHEIMRA